MTLIKKYFVGSLRALTGLRTRPSLSPFLHLALRDVANTAQMHLLYTGFTTVAGQLAPLLGEFERRARTHSEELGALLSECHAAYFGARKSLLVALIHWNNFQTINKTLTILLYAPMLPYILLSALRLTKIWNAHQPQPHIYLFIFNLAPLFRLLNNDDRHYAADTSL